jgi:hypothetical protein
VASRVEATAESEFEFPPDSGLGVVLKFDRPSSESLGDVERRLVSLCCERGPLRAVLARIAFRLVLLRAWERLGFARISDYARECLGVSGRSVWSLAEVGARLGELALLEQALVSGTLGWTKVRLLARLPEDEDEGAWIGYARRVTADELSKVVRVVDRGSIEAGAAEAEGARSRLFEVRCSSEERGKWRFSRSAAARVAGRVLHVSEAAELIAAEVLSALPIEEEKEACEAAGVSWSRASEDAPPWRAVAGGAPYAKTLRRLPCPRRRAASSSAGESSSPRRAGPSSLARFGLPPSSFPSELRPLLEGLEEADAFVLDERLQRAVSLEQRLDARIGALLAQVWGRFVYRAQGHPSREAWARERLGMDPTRARALVRLERAAALDGTFARTWRTGALSWVKAGLLVPLVKADPLGGFVAEWVGWAGRVTVRRLGEDVERALALAEMDPQEFRRGGGLPPEAREGAEREVCALETDPGSRSGEAGEAGEDRGIGALTTGGEEDPVKIGAWSCGPDENTEDDSSPEDETPQGPAADEAGREIRALEKDAAGNRGEDGEVGEAGDAAEDRGIGALGTKGIAPQKEPEICWARFIGPSDVVQLFQAVLCTVRRRMGRESGRLPTAGEALGVMLDHCLSTWGVLDRKIAARHKVFDRDGWRCTVPGCTSMQNLHDHHIRYRSAQGSNALTNRTAVCAYHHLRGLHAGLLRCVGRAPDALRWEMGIRPGVTPRLVYRSGDVRIRRAVP